MEKEIKRGRKKKEIDGNFAKLLSELLQKVKTENGIIQDDVAKAIGISRQALGKWANGETVPDILDLKKLAKYFNVSSDYLLGFTDIPSTDLDLIKACEYTGLDDEAVKALNDSSTNMSTNFSKMASRFIKSKRFTVIISHLIELSENNVNWLRQCEKYIKKDRENSIYNDELKNIAKECDYHKTAILENIFKILKSFDRVSFLYSEEKTDEVFFEEMKKNILNPITNFVISDLKEVSENGKHNPSEE